MSFHPTDTTSVESTFQFAIASGHVILSLPSQAERRRIAITQIAQTLAQGLAVVCIAQDAALADDVRTALALLLQADPSLKSSARKQWQPWDEDYGDRDAFDNFYLMHPRQFQYASHDAFWTNGNDVAASTVSLLVIADFDLFNLKQRGYIENGLVAFRNELGELFNADFDPSTLEEHGYIEDGWVAFRNELDERFTSTNMRVLVTMTPSWDATAFAQLISAAIVEPDELGQDAARAALPLAINDPQVFDTYLLAESRRWNPAIFDTRLEATFDRTVVFANAAHLAERRQSLIQRGFIIAETPRHPGSSDHRLTDLGTLTLQRNLNLNKASTLARIPVLDVPYSAIDLLIIAGAYLPDPLATWIAQQDDSVIPERLIKGGFSALVQYDPAVVVDRLGLSPVLLQQGLKVAALCRTIIEAVADGTVPCSSYRLDSPLVTDLVAEVIQYLPAVALETMSHEEWQAVNTYVDRLLSANILNIVQQAQLTEPTSVYLLLEAQIRKQVNPTLSPERIGRAAKRQATDVIEFAQALLKPNFGSADELPSIERTTVTHWLDRLNEILALPTEHNRG